MKSKKLLAGMISASLILGGLTGCGKSGSSAAASGDTTDSKLKIVTTIFPEYDWVKNIMGDKADGADITLLLDNGVDIHSYSPSVQDMAMIKECDMFVYVGGESDSWVDGVLESTSNENMVVINLLDVLGESVKEEEVVEGMEHDHDHGEAEEDHDHEEAEEDHDHEEAEEAHDHEHEEPEMDEHVWLSLNNASVICEEIAEALTKLDPDNSKAYKANLESYKAELSGLDAEYQSAVDSADKKTLLFGDRFPFRYMVDDYGLDYYAAFTGCSAESEASFETVVFLAEKTDELGLTAVMTIDGSDQKIAETVISNTQNKDQKILTLDSMQSVTSEKVASGTTYISVMKSNLEVLKEALK